MPRMDIGLVMAPGWDMDQPPLGLALLKPHLARQGRSAFVHDLAARLLRRAPASDRAVIANVDPLLQSAAFVHGMFERNRDIVEETVEELLDSGAPAFGFSLYFSTREPALALARRIKSRDRSRLVLFGGPDCSGAKNWGKGTPEWTSLDVADAVVPGEGEPALGALLDGARPNGFARVPGAFVKTGGDFVWGGEAPAVQDLDSLPFADFSDTPPRDYRSGDALATYMTRGCIKKCVFCDVEFHWGGYRCRTGRRVFEEIAHQVARHPGVKRFWFCDSIVNADLKALETLCDLLIEARRQGRFAISWTAYAVIRPDMKPPLLRKMAESGCAMLHIGIESGSQRVLDSMRKGCRVATAEQVLRDLHEAGIGTTALMMIGFPTETREDFQQTLDFMRRVAPFVSRVQPSEAMTYIGEGTPLKERAAEFGVDLARFHGDFWRLRDGSNDYPERLRRLCEFCEEMESLEIPISCDRDRVLTKRATGLAAYRAFLDGRAGP